MTKRFALADTLPRPYFTVDAPGSVTVKAFSMESGRMMVEIWRDGIVLCRVFANTVVLEGQPSLTK